MQKKVLLTLSGVGIIALAATGYVLMVPRGEPIPDPPIPKNLETLAPALSDLVHKGRNAILDSKGNADRWLELGMVYMANLSQFQALECFEQATQLDPECAQCWYYIAQVHHVTRSYDESIETMQLVTQLEGRYAPAFWRLGFWQLDQGELEKAEAAFLSAAQIAPRDPAGWFGLATVRMSQHRDAEAAAILEDLLDWTPINRYHANFLLGTVYRRMGRIEEAKRLLMGSEGPSLKWPDSWTNNVTKYFRRKTWEIDRPLELMVQGRIDEAINILQGLLRDEPENIDYLNNLAVGYRGQGRFEESNATFKKVIGIKPSHYLARSNLGLNYLVMAQQTTDPEAVAEYERLGFLNTQEALRVNPVFSDARGQLAQFHERRGEYDQALENFRLAANDPTKGMRWLNAMIARLLEMERWDEAAEVLFELSYRFVPQPGSLYGLCITLCTLERLDEARETADRYANLWPNDARVMELRQIILDTQTAIGQRESDQQ